MSEKTFQEHCTDVLPFIQAGSEGKEVQWFSTMEQQWYDCRPTSIVTNCKLRLKPVVKYRPLTHQELAGHIGNKVRDKHCKSSVYVIWGLTGDERVSFRESPRRGSWVPVITGTVRVHRWQPVRRARHRKRLKSRLPDSYPFSQRRNQADEQTA